MKMRRRPEQIREPSAEQQCSAEGDRVRGDHPLQALLREVEVGLDRRQRNVHDCHVEDDHELCDDDQTERPPAPALPAARNRGITHLSSP
jgi:hypothetical protein